MATATGRESAHALRRTLIVMSRLEYLDGSRKRYAIINRITACRTPRPHPCRPPFSFDSYQHVSDHRAWLCYPGDQCSSMHTTPSQAMAI